MTEYNDTHYIRVMEHYISKIQKNRYAWEAPEWQRNQRDCQHILHKRIMSRMGSEVAQSVDDE